MSAAPTQLACTGHPHCCHALLFVVVMSEADGITPFRLSKLFSCDFASARCKLPLTRRRQKQVLEFTPSYISLAGAPLLLPLLSCCRTGYVVFAPLSSLWSTYLGYHAIIRLDTCWTDLSHSTTAGTRTTQRS
jgi:hypothetical protein